MDDKNKPKEESAEPLSIPPSENLQEVSTPKVETAEKPQSEALSVTDEMKDEGKKHKALVKPNRKMLILVVLFLFILLAFMGILFLRKSVYKKELVIAQPQEAQVDISLKAEAFYVEGDGWQTLQ